MTCFCEDNSDHSRHDHVKSTPRSHVRNSASSQNYTRQRQTPRAHDAKAYDTATLRSQVLFGIFFHLLCHHWRPFTFGKLNLVIELFLTLDVFALRFLSCFDRPRLATNVIHHQESPLVTPRAWISEGRQRDQKARLEQEKRKLAVRLLETERKLMEASYKVDDGKLRPVSARRHKSTSPALANRAGSEASMMPAISSSAKRTKDSPNTHKAASKKRPSSRGQREFVGPKGPYREVGAADRLVALLKDDTAASKCITRTGLWLAAPPKGITRTENEPSCGIWRDAPFPAQTSLSEDTVDDRLEDANHGSAARDSLIDECLELVSGLLGQTERPETNVAEAAASDGSAQGGVEAPSQRSNGNVPLELLAQAVFQAEQSLLRSQEPFDQPESLAEDSVPESEAQPRTESASSGSPRKSPHKEKSPKAMINDMMKTMSADAYSRDSSSKAEARSPGKGPISNTGEQGDKSGRTGSGGLFENLKALTDLQALLAKEKGKGKGNGAHSSPGTDKGPSPNYQEGSFRDVYQRKKEIQVGIFQHSLNVC